MRTQAQNFTLSMSFLFFMLTFGLLLPSQAQTAKGQYAVFIEQVITSPQKDNYKKLQEIGDVYYVIQSPGYKIYLGSFPTYDAGLTTQRYATELGYGETKIERIPANVRTNLLWGRENKVDIYSNFTPRGVGNYNSQKELITEIRVYRNNGSGWATTEGTFLIETDKRAMHNERSQALNFDKNATQRIYFDVRYKNHKINPLDLDMRIQFGSESRKLVHNAKDNSYQFNAFELTNHPTQLAYTLSSERYDIQLDVNIPVRWINTIEEPSPEPLAETFVPETPVEEYEIYTPRSNRYDSEEESYVLPISYGYEASTLTAKGKKVRSYFIQVAALGKRPNPDKFSDLERYGDITYSYDNDVYRVKVGAFNSRKSAESTLQRIKRSYRGAFIIEEFSPEEFQERSAETAPRSYEYTNSRSASSDRYRTEKYVVKLAAYSDPSWFDSAEIDDMGICWEVKKGRLTVKYITLNGRLTPYQADAALRDIREAGFYEAVLMRKNEKGRLEVVE